MRLVKTVNTGRVYTCDCKLGYCKNAYRNSRIEYPHGVAGSFAETDRWLTLRVHIPTPKGAPSKLCLGGDFDVHPSQTDPSRGNVLSQCPGD